MGNEYKEGDKNILNVMNFSDIPRIFYHLQVILNVNLEHQVLLIF